MGRNKSFDQQNVLRLCADIFISNGYEGTSIDQLVVGTGLLRGSLYGTFYSKRGLFVSTLKNECSKNEVTPRALDICIIGLLELAAKDVEVKEIIEKFLLLVPEEDRAYTIGDRVLRKATLL